MKKQRRAPTLNDIKAEKGRRSFHYFVNDMWDQVDPDEFVDAWYIKCLCEHLQAVFEGRVKNLVINIPPGLGKSLICSVLYPAWTWAVDPKFSFLCSTKAAGNLKRDAFKFYNLVNGDKFKSRFGETFNMGNNGHAIDDPKRKVSEGFREIQNDKMGYRRAITTGAATTGARGKIIMLDDPNDRSEVDSKVKRESTNNYVFKTLSTRNFAKRGGAMIIVMQRLHEEDVAGMAIKKGFPHLKIPMEMDGTSSFALEEWEDPREEGEFLIPDLYDGASKEDTLTKMSTLEYEGQYQQSPTLADGNIIKRDWVRYWKELPFHIDEYIQSWDFAAKDKSNSDFTVGQVWARKGADKYLIYQIRGVFSFPDACQQVINMTNRYPMARRKFIEDKANGPAIIQTLRSKVAGLIPVEPRGDKVARVNAITPDFESGNVYFPDPSVQPWVERTFEPEIFSFPNGKNDDQVDAMSQALDKLRSNIVSFTPMSGSSNGF